MCIYIAYICIYLLSYMYNVYIYIYIYIYKYKYIYIYIDFACLSKSVLHLHKTKRHS